MVRKTLIACALSLASLQLSAQVQLDSLDDSYINISTVAQDIYWPWEIIWGPDNHIWMTQQGLVNRVDPQTGDIKGTILNLSDFSLKGSKQMGLAIHPQFSTNHYVYVDYNYEGDSYNPHYDNEIAQQNDVTTYHNLYMKIVRYTYNVGKDLLENPSIIVDNIRIFDGYHDGGKMVISDNHIFLTIGDAKQEQHPILHPYIKPGDPYLAQNTYVFNGKVLRLNLDGSVPEDNPFAKVPYDKTPRNLIWSYGHRNPQGLVSAKGRLYYADHGRDNDDEFGIIEKGMNYGWPLIEGFCDSLKEQVSCDTILNYKDPLYAFNPNVAPSDMEYIEKSTIPEFNNSILIGTLTGDDFGKHIAMFTLNEKGDQIIAERKLFYQRYGRIRDLCISPIGEVYFITSNSTGSNPYPDQIMKISFAGSKAITVALDDEIKSEVLLFPNPSGSERKLNVKLSSNQGTLTLYQSNGSLVDKFNISEKEMTIDVSRFARGIYFLRYNNGDKNINRKVIFE